MKAEVWSSDTPKREDWSFVHIVKHSIVKQARNAAPVDGQYVNEVTNVLILLIVLTFLLLSIILPIIAALIQKKANESTFDVTTIEEDIDQGKILPKVDFEYEIVETRSLDQQCADARRMTICPYCETFNSQTSEKCCACGQAIHK